jgi:hypothetical protein
METIPCDEFRSWLLGQELQVRVEILVEAEKLKIAGLGRETAMTMIGNVYEPHVVPFDSGRCYLLFARNILDGLIIFLGHSPFDLGINIARRRAALQTEEYFR